MYNFSELYEQGNSLREIERITGINRKRIAKELRLLDKRIRPKKDNRIGESELTELYINQRKTTRQIGVLYNRSREYVRKRLMEFNIPIRHGSDAIKVQWENNNKRKSDFGKLMSEYDRSGASHSQWSGGLSKTASGYVLEHCPDHPRSHGGYVRQHILVMEKYLGRYLNFNDTADLESEVVHHINGDKTDNRIENLQLMTVSEHNRLPRNGN